MLPYTYTLITMTPNLGQEISASVTFTKLWTLAPSSRRTQMSPARAKQGRAGDVTSKMACTASLKLVYSATDLKPKFHPSLPETGQSGWLELQLSWWLPLQDSLENPTTKHHCDCEKDHPFQHLPDYPTSSQWQICWPNRLSYWVLLPLHPFVASQKMQKRYKIWYNYIPDLILAKKIK